MEENFANMEDHFTCLEDHSKKTCPRMRFQRFQGSQDSEWIQFEWLDEMGSKF